MERISRRSFLTTTGGVIAGAALGRPGAAQPRSSDKVRIGVIGVGGQGAFSWRNLGDEEIVMLCDVDLARVAPAVERFPKAEVVQDFRRVLDRKDIDAVVVATPDHWHAIPSVWAMQTGKHVYCEKPLAHSVYECRVMAETAKRQRLVTQMGTQIHAQDNYRRVVELVQGGAIGTVKRVDVWCNRRPDPGNRALTGTAPASLDYELWVGPAAYRPFDPNVVPFRWRWWWDFGGGVLADMACHYMDLPHWALNLRHPERVAATGTEFPDADNKVPVEMKVDYRYAARGDLPAVDLTWWHGNPGPKDASGNVVNYGLGSAVLFHGEKGDLLADYNTHKLLPEDQFRDFKRPPQSLPASLGHHKEWTNAIKNGGPTTCNFEYSGALSETVLLGNLSYRLGKALEWDPKGMKIKNLKDDEYRPLLRPDYRGDWKLKR